MIKRAKDLRAEAKNGLEAYCASLVCKKHLQELMIFAIDARRVELAVHNTLDWLTNHPLAEKEEFEAKQKELEGVVNPIMMKVYQAAGGGGGMPEGGMPGGGGAPGGGAGPTVEEVD